MPASGADPFHAGPYTRLQTPLGHRSPWVERTVSRAVVLALVAWLPLGLLVAALLPFVPLLLTVVPVNEILRFASKLVL